MAVAIRTMTRLQDADDAPTLGAGQDGYTLTWDNASGAFVATALFTGGLLATGATTGATSQAQTFTNGIIINRGSEDTLFEAITLTTPATNVTNFGLLMDDRAVFNAVRNSTLAIGYNPNFDATKASQVLTWEAHYQYGAALSRSEFYLSCVAPSGIGGTSTRPYMVNLEHQSDSVIVYHDSDQHIFTVRNTTSTVTIKGDGAGAGDMTLANTTVKVLQNNTNVFSQLNAGGTAYLPIFKINSSNQVELGSSVGPVPVYIPGGLLMQSLITSATAGIYGTLADSMALAYPSYPTTYRHLIRSSVSDGGTGNAAINLIAFEVCNGTSSGRSTPLKLRGDNRAIVGAPASAIADADLGASQISFSLDESGNTLTVKAKYANGTTIKTGTVALA